MLGGIYKNEFRGFTYLQCQKCGGRTPVQREGLKLQAFKNSGQCYCDNCKTHTRAKEVK